MCYAAVFDNRDLEIPIIGILDKAPHAEVGKYTTYNHCFDTCKLLIQ